MDYSGAGRKLIHEKNQKQKISWHCPFKQLELTVVYNLAAPATVAMTVRSSQLPLQYKSRSPLPLIFSKARRDADRGQ
jgi:hypothetical protein